VSRPKRTHLKQSDSGEQIQFPSFEQISRVPRIAFGIVPLTTPYSESDPDHRVLNAVARGLVFDGIKDAARELEMSKTEFSRTLRSLRNDGLVFVDQDGKYRLTFGTSNFPNLIPREDSI
jgi:DNA-binding transcriptional ArsR family regulator